MAGKKLSPSRFQLELVRSRIDALHGEIERSPAARDKTVGTALDNLDAAFDAMYAAAQAPGKPAAEETRETGEPLARRLAMQGDVAERERLLAELRAQAEELEAANWRLSEQAAELEVKSEELHTQNEELIWLTHDLELARARLQAIIECMPAGVAIADPSGQLVLGNRRLEEIVRAPFLVSTSIDDFAGWLAFHPDGPRLENEEQALSRALLRGEVVLDQHVEIKRGDGTWGTISANAAPVYDGQGRLVGAVSVVVDITERKRAADALRRQMQVTAELEERQRLARELHDSVSQALYGIGLGVRTARAHLGHDEPQAREALDYTLTLAQMGLSDMRALIFDLRPESLAAEGLAVALAKRATFIRNRQGVQVEADLADEPDVPFETKAILYAIAREALHNTLKHARAKHIALRLYHDEHELVLEIADDGIGFDPGRDYAGHFGLPSMRERAAFLGGTLRLDSAPGSGTRVRVSVPGQARA